MNDEDDIQDLLSDDEDNVVTIYPSNDESESTKTTPENEPSQALELLQRRLDEQSQELARLRSAPPVPQYNAPVQDPTPLQDNKSQLKAQFEAAYLSDPAGAMMRKVSRLKLCLQL